MANPRRLPRIRLHGKVVPANLARTRPFVKLSQQHEVLNRQFGMIRSAIKRLTDASALTDHARHDFLNVLNETGSHLVFAEMEITDHPNAVPDIPQYVKTKTEQVRRRLEAVARLNRVAFDILDTNAKNTLREWGAVALSNRIVSYPLAMAGYQGKKHILVENTCARGVRLQADARWLSRAVLNLSTNALRAIPDSGGVVRVRTATHKNAFVVTVSDTGPGMNAAQKAKFRNRARFSTQAGDGHGIGSSVVHQAVELHGGKVEVSDNVPHGTVFELSIPIKR